MQAAIDNSKIEVQLAHEKSEWAYATYAMGPQGCIFSDRFEYDADKAGDRQRAKKEAMKDYERLQGCWPGCSTYSDL